MENYPSYSYPDSGDSSPRSREIDFENPPPSWEDPHTQPQQQLTKVKLMVSYGGKIQPRSHDNILSYVGGETKILSVDRSLKFSSLFSKLSSILSSDPGTEPVSGFTFKYQLPGEDLDALISVTNDDDLENMMHEYDRLCRGSSKPARLRVFLFPVLKTSSFGSTSSDKIDRDSDRFVDALNSGLPQPPVQTQVNNNNDSNMDFFFGLEKPSIPVPVQVQVPIPVQRHEPDPQIDARIQELNRMQISVQEMNRSKSEDGSMFPGGTNMNIPVGYWQQQPPPPPPPQQPPVNMEQPQPPQPSPQLQPQSQPLPQFQQLHHFQQPPQQISQPPQQQVYMVHHAPPQGNMYHAPIMRPVTNQQVPPQQGYYRMGSEQVYREQPVYKYNNEGMGGVPGRPVAGMEGSNNNNNVGYHHQQVAAYDSGSGRQVYYAAQPVTAPFQGVSGEMRTVPPVSAPISDVNAKVIPK